MRIVDPVVGIDTEPRETMHIEPDAAAPVFWIETVIIVAVSLMAVIGILKLLF